MHTNRFWELMAKHLSGEITPEEMQELNYLKGEDEFLVFNDALLQKVSALSLQQEGVANSENVQEKWLALQQKITAPAVVASKPTYSLRPRKILGYAAAAAVLTVLAIAGWKWLNPATISKISQPNIVSTRNGSRTKVQMPDGTQIWLNAGSSLKYNNATYGEKLREVELVGEAYFDVTKDAAHPFVIHTKAMDVKVLGTAFNIRAYPNEKQTQTALIRGSIEVSFPGRPSEKLFLKPNEKITVSNTVSFAGSSAKPEAAQAPETAPLIVLSTIDHESADSAVVETSWTRNKLIFRNKSFDELAQDMERWYNVSIRFADSSLMERHLTGTFYNETIFEALDYLKISSPFQYTYSKESNTILLQAVPSHTKK